MSKKPLFRTLLDNHHAKGSQPRLKSTQQRFCHVFSPPGEKYGWKLFLLVISEILGLFFNIFTADYSILFVIGRIYCN